MGFSTVKRRINRDVEVDIEHTPYWGRSVLVIRGCCEQGDLIETFVGSGTRLYQLIKCFDQLEVDEGDSPYAFFFWEARLVDWDVDEREEHDYE